MTKSEGSPNDKASQTNSSLAELFGNAEFGLVSSFCFLHSSFGALAADRSCRHALRFDLCSIRAFERPCGFYSLAQPGQPRERRPLVGRTSRPNPPHESAAAGIELRQPRAARETRSAGGPNHPWLSGREPLPRLQGLERTGVSALSAFQVR